MVATNQAKWKDDRQLEAEYNGSQFLCHLPQNNSNVRRDIQQLILTNNWKSEQISKLSQRIQELETKVELLEKSNRVDLEQEIIELKVMPVEQAMLLIEKYVKDNQGVRTSDIICDLSLDPNLVVQALHNLQEEKKVKGKNIE
ncbi:MAG: hypothetical protein LBH62_07200 [Nitrososphaerota archaeon]|jgi:predicted nuclease with TOPRIM domain|uniref:hypothetical protein n=1 Tax=Candidatus Bathycorpusculum sp. TaxID=2994959 RepID=UPI002816B213|nr:hypothetical protein [Candidatus Termiticorpusculum sp.]MCL2291520.1 hypothetical protein [Candidatus Termiticorpusculum sp.]MDR0461196.1 hypothetical protein [Nitrososphaerota archaeon]